MSSFKKFKEELTKLDRVSWSEAEQLVKDGGRNVAVEALLPIVPHAAKSYAKATALHNFDYDDLIAICNLALVEAVDSWEEGGYKLSSWCYRKVGRDMGRHVGKELDFEQLIDEESLEEQEDTVIDPALTPEEYASQSRIRKLIEDRFPPDEAEILVLIYFHDITIKSIAAQRKVSEAYVSKLHRNALKVLKDWLIFSESSG